MCDCICVQNVTWKCWALFNRQLLICCASSREVPLCKKSSRKSSTVGALIGMKHHFPFALFITNNKIVWFVFLEGADASQAVRRCGAISTHARSVPSWLSFCYHTGTGRAFIVSLNCLLPFTIQQVDFMFICDLHYYAELQIRFLLQRESLATDCRRELP